MKKDVIDSERLSKKINIDPPGLSPLMQEKVCHFP